MLVFITKILGGREMVFSEMFKALADPARRDILTFLKNGEQTAGTITQQFNLTGPTISYHLSVLKKANLIYANKHKIYIYYQINISVFEEISLWISQFKGGKIDEK